MQATVLSIVISGSFRKALKEMSRSHDHLCAAGFCVLAPESFDPIDEHVLFVRLKTDDPTSSARTLEEVFLEQIATSNGLYVVNPNGYIGESVAMEILFADAHGIPICLSCPIETYSERIPSEVVEYLRSCTFDVCSIDSIHPFLFQTQGAKHTQEQFAFQHHLTNFLTSLL